jgi:hypothetical protein
MRVVIDKLFGTVVSVKLLETAPAIAAIAGLFDQAGESP